MTEKDQKDEKDKPNVTAGKSAGTPNDDAAHGKASRARKAAGLAMGGLTGLVLSQGRTGQQIAERAANMAGAGAKLSTAARFVPGLGAIASVGWAAKELRDGDYIGAGLAAVGAIPGPIGWAGVIANMAWNTWGDATIGQWDAPNGTNTQMLPGAASEISGVTDADAALTEAQRGVFSFQDGPNGKVWNSSPPAALRIDTPAVKTAVAKWLNELSEAWGAVEAAMAASPEPYVQQYREKLAPHFQAMAELRSAPDAIIAQLTAISTAAGDAYAAVLVANRAVRVQLSEDGECSDAGPVERAAGAVSSAAPVVERADAALASLFAGAPAAAMTATRSAPGVGASAPTPTPPVPNTPAPGAPAPVAPPKDSKDDLSQLLTELRKSQPAMGNPMGGMGSPMGGGAPGGTPLAGPTTTPKSEGRKLDDGLDRKRERREEKPKLDDKSLAAAKPDNKPAAAPPPTAPAPLATAGTATAVGPKPEAAKPPAKPENTEVNVKGEKVSFPDAKTAKLAQLLATANPNNPISLSDAAAQAGLTPPFPGQDPGAQVAPVDAKPGDVLVAGEKSFMVLGEGKFYDLKAFQVVAADMLPKDLGDRAGYFRLGDPGDSAGGPVSGPTRGAVPFGVPGGEGVKEPVDPAATPSVPVTGTPGMPKQAEGAGPANEASTDTGIGETLPSASTQRLDPGAVK